MQVLQLLTLLVATGAAAQWAAARLRVPSLLFLLLFGLLLGPLPGLLVGNPELRVLDPDRLFGKELLTALIKLAVAIVLFEGGLSLHLREVRVVGNTLWRLLASGLVVGSTVVTLAGIQIGGLRAGTAAVFAGILVVTGPTVVIPMLRNARIALRPATLLKWEAIVNDPLGALLAIFALELAVTLTASPSAEDIAALLGGFTILVATSTAAGGIFGWMLGRALDTGLIAEHLKSPVMLAVVLVVFTASETFHHEAGLLTVTAMGVVLANTQTASLEDIRHFKEQMSTLLVAFLFLVLAARLDLRVLERLDAAKLGLIAVVLLVARPLVALAATTGTQIPWRERALIGWIAPRGVVAAAMAGAFDDRLLAAGYEDAMLLVPLVFGVIIATVVLHGLSVRPLARWLGLGAGESGGILIVGAATWAIALAQALTRAGAYVVVADTRYRRVTRARVEGLEVHYGDVLSEETALELPLERISWLLAATAQDAYNALVCRSFVRELGRPHVLQLTPAVSAGERKEFQPHMAGVTPWGEPGTYQAIARRFWKGESFKVTQVTEAYTFEQLRADNPAALFLFWVHDGRMGVLDNATQPPKGARLVYLASDRQRPDEPDRRLDGGK